MTWSALPFFYLQNIASRLLGSRHGTAVRPLYIEDPANAGFLSQSRFVSLDINSPAPSLLFRVHSPLGIGERGRGNLYPRKRNGSATKTPRWRGLLYIEASLPSHDVTPIIG